MRESVVGASRPLAPKALGGREAAASNVSSGWFPDSTSATLNWMRNRPATTLLAVCQLALVAWSAKAAEPLAARRALLSISGVPVPRDQSIFEYHVDISGVVPQQVCRIPSSWQTKVQTSEDLNGMLSARADFHGEQLRQLTNTYLVDVYGYSARGDANHAPSFSGWLRYGSRQAFGDWHGRKIRLRPSNFRLTDAISCPRSSPPRQ